MRHRFSQAFAPADGGLFMAAIVLTVVGVLMVFSSSGVVAQDLYGDASFYLKRQMLFVVAGFGAMFFMNFFRYQTLVRMGPIFLVAAVGFVMLTFVPGIGHTVNGARRWINFGGLGFQPAEFSKIFMLLYLVWTLVKRQDRLESFKEGLMGPLFFCATVAGMLLLQPDFGNATLLLTVSLLLMFFAGAPLRHLIGLGFIGAMVTVTLVASSPYRMRRIMGYLDPWSDVQNTGYQIVQSFTAFFQGGLWGKGLGNSQEKLYFLPEAHTDFIFSVLGEELGYGGVLLIVIAFFVFMIKGFQIARRAPDQAGFLLAAGSTSMIGIQSLMNMGVVTGLLPTKGIPLPFVSHGGSSLLCSFMATGLLLMVAKESKHERV